MFYNNIVRTELPKALEGNLGRIGLRYGHAFVAVLPLIGIGADRLAVRWYYDQGAKQFLLMVVTTLIKVCVGHLVILGLFALLVKASLRLWMKV